jgi:hypothetical protein
VNGEGFAHRHHGTWLLIRSCLQAAISLLAAKKARRLDDLLPKEWWTAVNKVLKLLMMWEEESADIKAYREILQDMIADVADEERNLQSN